MRNFSETSTMYKQKHAGVIIFAGFAAMFLTALFCRPAYADWITDDPYLPPKNATYFSESDPPIVFDLTGLGNPAWGIDTVELHRAVHGVRGPDTDPDPHREVFASEINLWLSINGGPQFQFFDPDVPVTTDSIVDSVVGNVTTWINEVIDMVIGGTISGLNVQIREDLDRDSMGGTTRTVLGGGLYEFQSFFDVFMELRLDDGINDTGWVDSSGGSKGDGSMHMLIPEPSILSLLALGLVVNGIRSREWYKDLES